MVSIHGVRTSTSHYSFLKNLLNHQQLPPMKEPWQRLKDDIRKIIYDTEPGKVNLVGSDPQMALCTISGLENARKVQSKCKPLDLDLGQY